MPMNAHGALNGPTDEAYLERLRLPKEREDELRAARDDLRQAIKEGMRDWEKTVPAERMLFRDAQIALRNEGVEPADAFGQPKFRMQGSFSYHTVNDPAKGKAPPLQVDLDDGMFLPARFISRDGMLEPSVAAEGYFEAVEKIVGRVCDARGWTLCSKASCVRVELDEGAHIDIALYAVPQSEFATLVETARAQGRIMALDAEIDDAEFQDAVYARLSEDQMRLARRGEDGRGDWVRSDPRKLENWFGDAVKDHGDQVRFVSRYLKAWRDEQDLDGLASIALMWAVVTTFEEQQGYQPFAGRDDLALVAVAQNLPDILRGKIPNPVVDGERLDQGWDEERRAWYVDAAEKLARGLDNALSQSHSPEDTIRELRAELGGRFPTDLHLIRDDGSPEKLAAPAALTHGLLDMETKADDRPAVKLDGDERYA